MPDKHTPLRMCVICRRRFEKKVLKRFILNLQGKPEEDKKGIKPGRGFYRCPADKCRKKFVLWKPAKRISKKAGVAGR